MGIDADFWAPVTGVDIAELRRRVKESEGTDAWVEIDVPGFRLRVCTLHRLYRPSYRRGCWPPIRRLIEAIRPMLPGLEYGSDDGDHGELVTDEMIAACDAAWAEDEADRARNGRPHGYVDSKQTMRRPGAPMNNPPAPGDWVEVSRCKLCRLPEKHPLHGGS
jgi:hypothetical protein